MVGVRVTLMVIDPLTVTVALCVCDTGLVVVEVRDADNEPVWVAEAVADGDLDSVLVHVAECVSETLYVLVTETEID